MAKKTKNEFHCGPTGGKMSCCKVESLMSVDERGQMVFLKEIRDKADIRSGDKLALVSWEKDGKICCFALIKVEEFTGMVRELLGPMMEEMIPKSRAH
jgi:antitoxin PrlF